MLNINNLFFGDHYQSILDFILNKDKMIHRVENIYEYPYGICKVAFRHVTERHVASCVTDQMRNIGDNLTMINSKYPSAFATVAGQHVLRSLLEALYFMTRQEGRRRSSCGPCKMIYEST